jgi:ElaB/YqjD/DUF883 family membrane-anchored ribosome-binding protein
VDSVILVGRWQGRSTRKSQELKLLEHHMDEDRLSGAAKKPHGQTQGAEESVHDLYGQAKDAAGEAIHAVGKMPASFEDTIRHYIQNRPYTTAAIALTLGWLIGRSHRPF